MATQNACIKRLLAPFDGFVVDGFNFVAQFPDVRHWLLTQQSPCGTRWPLV